MGWVSLSLTEWEAAGKSKRPNRASIALCVLMDTSITGTLTMVHPLRFVKYLPKREIRDKVQNYGLDVYVSEPTKEEILARYPQNKEKCGDVKFTLF